MGNINPHESQLLYRVCNSIQWLKVYLELEVFCIVLYIYMSLTVEGQPLKFKGCFLKIGKN